MLSFHMFVTNLQDLCVNNVNIYRYTFLRSNVPYKHFLILHGVTNSQELCVNNVNIIMLLIK